MTREKAIDIEQQPSDDCVSRANLISKLEILERRYGSDFYWETRKIVDKLPSVKPQEPKTGHWIKQHGLGIDINYEPPYKCSECNGKIRCTKSQLVNYPYCCHCGAKMVDEQESENKA